MVVGVEGNYPNENGNLRIQIDGKNLTAAETTVPGFKIGRTRTNKNYSLRDIDYIQKLNLSPHIIKAHSGKRLRPYRRY